MEQCLYHTDLLTLIPKIKLKIENLDNSFPKKWKFGQLKVKNRGKLFFSPHHGNNELFWKIFTYIGHNKNTFAMISAIETWRLTKIIKTYIMINRKFMLRKINEIIYFYHLNNAFIPHICEIHQLFIHCIWIIFVKYINYLKGKFQSKYNISF